MVTRLYATRASLAGCVVSLLIPSGLALASPTADDLTNVHRALSARHNVECGAAVAGVQAPVEVLVEIAEEATAPPWAGMRAASCLARLYSAESLPSMETWILDESKAGLALVVLGELDHMPEATARKLAKLALERGPEGSADRVSRSKVGGAP
jgi:hypothetical protein